ncbi:unnamed protein product [Pleuronectes platessa]|uniref:Uncharacterized protein n=1 Tax=Pleuronectes platessa TaxID=8262 RepID=A0A9N7UWC3_PLEPL|nr:unnamed protein product [Pleuronectes platessa]
MRGEAERERRRRRRREREAEKERRRRRRGGGEGEREAAQSDLTGLQETCSRWRRCDSCRPRAGEGTRVDSAVRCGLSDETAVDDTSAPRLDPARTVSLGVVSVPAAASCQDAANSDSRKHFYTVSCSRKRLRRG